MTNTTLREEIKKHYFFVESKTSIVDGLAKEEWSLNENALLDFIESKVKEAEKRGESNMKQRIQFLIESCDDYMEFIKLFNDLK